MNHLPKQFLEHDQGVQKKIVELGLFSWSAVQAELSSQKDLDSDQLIRIWKENGRKQGMLEKEREMQSKLDELGYLNYSLQKKLDQFGAEMDSEYKKKLAAEKELAVRQARLDMSEEYGKLKEEIVRLKAGVDFKSAYDFAQARFEEQCKANKELQEKVQELSRVKSSFHLGKEGEGEIEEFLKQIPEFDYANVHAEADKADFRITSKDKVVMILDSKKFTHSVPKKDRDKLIDNTDKDAVVAGGLLVSLSSKISARQHCEIEFTPNNKPILYLCLSGMTNEAKLHSLDMALKLLLRLVTLKSSNERDLLVEKIQNASCTLQEIAKRFENCKKNAVEIVENSKIGLADVKKVCDVLAI
jgi:hypothetical protein